jgi:WD40 repeat protein
VIARHTGAVTALAFDETGSVLASGGRDASVTRVAIDTGQQATNKLSNAALAIVFDMSGDVHAVTYAGTEERWPLGATPVVEVDHGLYSGTTLGNGRWVLAFEDGTLLVTSRSVRPLAELRTLAERTTTLRR